MVQNTSIIRNELHDLWSVFYRNNLGVPDLPIIDKNHQSTRRGVYVIGDLVNAPVIKAAFKQGEALGKHLIKSLNTSTTTDTDVVIVGAGPAGAATAIALKESQLRVTIIDQKKAFSTIDSFIDGKKIYAQPTRIDNHQLFQFNEASKEVLVEDWRQTLIDQGVHVLDGHKLTSILGKKPNFELTLQTQSKPLTLHAQVVVLATGKRGAPNKLNIPGEDLPHVHQNLSRPHNFSRRRTTVIGGGNTAAESALALSEAGAEVSLVYRSSTLYRLSIPNQKAIEFAAQQKKIKLYPNSECQEITTESVHTSTAVIQSDDIFVQIGSHLPKKFLNQIGLRCTKDRRWWSPIWLLSFFLLSYLFYVLKQDRDLPPFTADGIFGWLPDMLVLSHPDHTFNGGFWGTLIYSALVMGFGIRAYLRTELSEQRKRYLMLIGFQVIFLFGIPELMSPAIFALGGAIDSLYFDMLGGMRSWKWYSLGVPWPLNIYALIDAPSWTETQSTTTPLLWLLAGAAVTFGLIPLYVRHQGQRFCSYLCGCGGLAESLGDFWRHLAPRGQSAKNLEKYGRFILILAVPVTVISLIDAWQLFEATFWGTAATWSRNWYGLMVDFGLASVLGVGLYPYLGNRAWCRFFCPLRAYMESLSRRFSRIAIQSTDTCIGCSECTRYCQMGIDVQRFAQAQLLLDNRNSACIQCGVCIEVCPMEVLSIGEAGTPVKINFADILTVPRAPWEKISQ